MEIKRRFIDPLIAVAGDFNQWKLEEALTEFPDLREVHVGPTRGDRAIDHLFCNMHGGMEESETVPPLETESEDEAAKSDHLIMYMRTSFPRREAYEWPTYSYRLMSDDSVADFGEWIVHTIGALSTCRRAAMPRPRLFRGRSTTPWTSSS